MPKGLSAEAKSRLVEALEEIRLTYREPQRSSGWQSDLAEKIGWATSTISRAARGEGGSADLAEAVARILGVPAGEILYGAKSSNTPALREVTGYRKCLAAAKERADVEHAGIPEHVWERVGNFRSRPQVSIVTPGYLYELAVLIHRETKDNAD